MLVCKTLMFLLYTEKICLPLLVPQIEVFKEAFSVKALRFPEMRYEFHVHVCTK